VTTAGGRASDAAFCWPIRVYWEDTDAGGVVYHARYLNFLERARTEWLRSLGIDQSHLASERGILFAVTAMELRFLAPARLDDELIVGVRLARRRPASLEFSQHLVRRRDNSTILTAGVRAACLDAASFRPRPIPEDLFTGVIE
jgi:acyl-CoA thioester hydrolase